VGRIQPRPRVSIVRWNLKEGCEKSFYGMGFAGYKEAILYLKGRMC
jgi:hypothetical protein